MWNIVYICINYYSVYVLVFIGLCGNLDFFLMGWGGGGFKNILGNFNV